MLEQIGRIIQDYLGKGGEERLYQMIRQELAGASEFDASELWAVRQRKADIDATIDNLLDNITATNREFVDRRIEKLRDEMVDLERREAALTEQQDQEAQTEVFARQAMGVIRDFDRLVAQGTVEEKRTLIRAFLRVLEFDPTTRKGIAHFWVVPSVGQDEFFAGPPRRGRRNPPPTTDPGTEASGSAQERTSSDGSGVRDTRYQYERHATDDGMSSLDVVAGAGFEPATSGL